MSDPQNSPPNSPVEPDLHVRESSHPDMEDYAGGYIQARVGYIPLWLLAVYAVLFVWAMYYMISYWGGVGPGRP